MAAPSMRRTVRWAVTAFGVVAVWATASLFAQLGGLYGSSGIAPIAETMASLARGRASWLDAPTLFWLGTSDGALALVAGLAVAASVCLAAGVAPRLAALALAACWLSFLQVGSPFLDFQWDLLLLEGAVLVAALSPWGLRPFSGPSAVEPSLAVRFAFAVLCCKVTLGSGIVKLASGDPAWRDLTALTWHWWTQPLPTWTSVIANGFGLPVQKALCAAMFVLELPVPLLALGPRRARLVAAGGLIALQAGLFAAGNYSFFNVLTAALAVPLLDDAAIGRPSPRVDPPRGHPLAWALAVAYLVLSGVAFSRRFVAEPPLRALLERVEPLHVVNAYGAFAVMTKQRAEIVLEGSDDGLAWRPYEFKWKPGRLDRRPDFVAPWQPRLDWQMWFAALGSCDRNPWLLAFLRHLLLGTAAPLALLESNPFAARPPRYVRARAFEYRFSPPGADDWWTRSDERPYCPPLALDGAGRLRLATGRSPPSP
ncbi:MAG: lipase maturation factor family protein [Myxococcaceae bacterium]|nr:lipase maturation factor family protein [Myxococcaceae bacterium]